MSEILILSAGRRVSLVRSFQEAALSKGLSVTGADMNPMLSAACQVADKSVVLPHVGSPEYANALLQYCSLNDVKMVVPTIDTELAKLSGLRAELNQLGCEAIVCSPALIEVCRDKRLTAEFFDSFGLKSPSVFDLSELKYPILVKPFDGSLSAGITILRSREDLSTTISANPKNMFCQYLDPAEYAEYTCDAYFDKDGALRCVVPRLRMEVRGGEVAKGRTEHNNIVDELFEKLSLVEGARGCLTIQIMRHRKTQDLYLIEVNARFGGGYPLTAKSGAAYHSWLIDEYIFGYSASISRDWRDGLTMLRYDAEIFTSDG